MGEQRGRSNRVPYLDERLLKVQFISEREGWAVGTYGVILRTLDGGAHWERLSFKEDVNLNDLCFLNASEGWVAGEFETILHTTDGGKTWRKQRGGKDGKLFGIGFRDALHGVAVGTSGKIVLTEDGGKSWREIKSPTEDTLLKVQFHGRRRAMAIARVKRCCGSDRGRWKKLAFDFYTGTLYLAFRGSLYERGNWISRRRWRKGFCEQQRWKKLDASWRVRLTLVRDEYVTQERR